MTAPALEAFEHRIRQAGLVPDAESIADLIHVAGLRGWLEDKEEGNLPKDKRPTPPTAPAKPPARSPAPPPTIAPQGIAEEEVEVDEVPLYPPDDDQGSRVGAGEKAGTGLREYSLSAGRPLNRAAELIASLRALRGRVRVETRELDEEAVVDHWLEAGELRPIHHQRKLPPARLTVVEEGSGPSRIWGALAKDWVEVLRMGSKAPVEHLWLHPAEDTQEPFALAKRPDAVPHLGERYVGALYPKRLILLFTDFSAPGWRDGSLIQLLQRWALHHVVTLVTPSPRALLKRTAVLRQAEEGQAHLADTPHPRWLSGSRRRFPLFLLRPEPGPVLNWARTVTGREASGHLAVAWPTELVRLEPKPDLPALAPDEVASALAKSRRRLSPEADQLLQTLAAAPLTMGIMRLVQQSVYPWMGHEALAEVIHCGLLQARLAERSWTEPDRTPFDFRPLAGTPYALRDAIWQSSGNAHTKVEEVHRIVGGYLMHQYGPRWLEVAVMGPAEGSGGQIAAEVRPLALVLAHLWETYFDGHLRERGKEWKRRILTGPRDRDGAAGLCQVSEDCALGVKRIVLLFRPIQAGTFLMGSPQGEEGRYDEETQYEVRLTQDFEIANTPVTQAQWEAVVGSNPSWFKGAGPDAPVENVSWKDAMDFCECLTKSDKQGWVYLLPTEAQWEYACRAGTTGPYNVDGLELNNLGWYKHNSCKTTHPVGEKMPNAWSLFDMHGNVWEWCRDCSEPRDKQTACSQELIDNERFRIIRGGSWYLEARHCRSAMRRERRAVDRFNYVGFRPVRLKCSLVGNASEITPQGLKQKSIVESVAKRREET